MLHAVDAEHTDQTAHRAGDDHGEQDDLIGAQAGEEGEARILAGDAHFVADGGALHHIPHKEGHHRRGKHGAGEVGAGNDIAEPVLRAELFGRGDHVLIGVLPRTLGEVLAEVGSDGVEHDGGDDLIDLDLHLQNAGEEGVQAADRHRGERRADDDKEAGLSVHPHADLRGKDRAEEQLALAADVEDADARAEHAGQTAQAKHHGVFQQITDVAGAGERAVQHGKVGLAGREARNGEDDRADDEREYHAQQQRDEIAGIDPFFHACASSRRPPVMQ